MDCSTTLEEIVDRCKKTGINCIAISDHGTADGALKFKNIDFPKIIVAEEILTTHGEIMGLFLKDTIPSGMSAEDTVTHIKQQNGLVCIPHPFDIVRPSALKYECLINIIEDVDIIEVFNARNHFSSCNQKAELLASQFDKLRSAGSDAHTAQEIGKTYIEMPDFDTKEDFLKSLAQGTIHGKMASPLVHFNSTANKIKKRLGHKKG
jgi:predicted metal-dependent phosphoesterase TrpH